MGDIYSITCRNKACRYHATLRDGVGMIGLARLKNFEEALLAGELQHEVALKSVKAGAEIESGAIFLCSKCKEFVSDSTYYLVENLTYSPFGTARYDISFPFGEPRCQKCGSKLEFIRNVLSSKVKCPRCGGELKSRVAGRFD